MEFRSGKSWIRGVVKSRLQNVMYEVTSEGGNGVVRHHVNQLQQHIVPDVKAPSKNESIRADRGSSETSKVPRTVTST